MTNWIGEYEALTEMKTVGSGSARWCIATRYGKHFFVKEFLSPVYPSANRDSALAKIQRTRCEVFEQQKKRLYAALSCVIGDTLVPVVDFFLHSNRYYAISEEVPKPNVNGEDVGRLSHKEMRGLFQTLAECLGRLHAQGIVHADLKPEHLLLVGESGNYSLRLIDLDSGFLEDDPPKELKEIEGDPVYLAPETFLRLTGESVPLTSGVDTFALGILIHRLWAGELPAIDLEKHTYLYEAALMGGEIRLSPALPLAYRLCVQRMLRKDPNQRPSDEEIIQLLAAPQGKPFQLKQDEMDTPLNGLSRLMKK